MEIIRIIYENQKQARQVKFTFELAGQKSRAVLTKNVSGASEAILFNLEDFENSNQEIEIKPESSEPVSTIFFPLYREDSILDLKKKIMLATNIPIYRQHLFILDGDKAVPLGYTVSFTNPDIREITLGNFIENIPIDEEFVNLEDYLIESFDEFRTLAGILEISDKIYLVDANDFFTNKPLIEQYMNDSYTFNLIYATVLKFWPMMTHEVFELYIRDESRISEIYPKLAADRDQVILQYNAQQEIIDTIFKYQPRDLTIGIITATLYNVSQNHVNLRNLFDKFVLTSKTPSIYARCTINGSKVYLSKYLKDLKTPFLISESLLINIEIELPNGLFSPATLTILENGTYYLETHWREDFFINFEILFEIVKANVNPILVDLNKMGKIISNKEFPLINNFITRLTDISLSIYWKKAVSADDYEIIMDSLNKMVKAGILANKKSASVIPEFVFLKGMHRFDIDKIQSLIKSITNYYSHFTDANISQKWEDLFMKNRVYKIIHRYSDIKIDVFNVRESELDIIYDYTSRLISSLEPKLKEITINPVNKRLKKLKETDPELYEFRKAYNSAEVISKKCQKQLQPLIYTSDEFEVRRQTLENPASVLEYWNFTTNEPAYYECPDSRYPYVRFITGVHPKGYCIPCCKKINITDETVPNSKKAKVHKSCLEKHNYKQSKTIKNKYVATFGRDLYEGQLSYLPENTLGKLFYGIDSVDDECKKNAQYFVVGCRQTMRPAIHIIAKCFEKTYDQVVQEIMKYYSENLSALTIMFNNMVGYSELERFLYSESGVVEDWNERIFQIYSQIKTNAVKFLIFETNIESSFVYLPELTDAEYIFVLKYEKKYYLIYYYDSVEYYKTGKLNNLAFKEEIQNNNRNIVQFIQNMAEKNNRKISTETLEKFTITDLFIGKNDVIYAALLKYKSQSVYVAIDNSYINAKILRNLSGKHKIVLVDKHAHISTNLGNVETTLDFFDEYNKSNALPLIPEAILIFEEKLIGIVAQGMNFYTNRVSANPDKLPEILGKLPKKVLIYDPEYVNSRILNSESVQLDIDRAIYERYLYKLIVLEFASVFSKDRNDKMRAQVLEGIKKNSINIPEMEKLEHIIQNYKDHKNENILKQELDTIDFEFDRITINKLQSLTLPEIYSELTKMAEDMFVEQNLDTLKISNMYVACADFSGTYCKKNKLIVPPGTLENYLQILASDISDPIRARIMFTKLFQTNIIDPYKFEKHGSEKIQVDIE